MNLIVRICLLVAAPLTALFVARESMQFDIMQTLVAVILIALVVGIIALGPLVWQRSRAPRDPGEL